MGTEVGGPIAAGVGAAGLRSHSEDQRALVGQSEGPRVRRLMNRGVTGLAASTLPPGPRVSCVLTRLGLGLH